MQHLQAKTIYTDTVQRIENFLGSLALVVQFPPPRFCVVWYQGFSNTRRKGDERIETTEDDITISASYMSQRNVQDTRNTGWLVAYNKGKRNAIVANSFYLRTKEVISVNRVRGSFSRISCIYLQSSYDKFSVNF
jgi:hypothetical protein